MCKVTSTLSYGILVRVISLCIAAEQWDDLRPVLLTLDLIKLRRSNNTLRVEQESRSRTEPALLKLPVEVWDAVRKEAVDGVKTWGSEYDFIWEKHCKGVEEWGSRPTILDPDARFDAKLDYEHFRRCFFCQQGFNVGEAFEVYEDVSTSCPPLSPSSSSILSLLYARY
jgi:hypothetical protein